jgi:hypothetical protein
MYKFSIRSIAVMTSIMLLCLGGSALAFDKTLGADDPNWVLFPNKNQVKVTSSSSALAMSVITIIYEESGGKTITETRHINFPRSGSIILTFSKQGKWVKQMIFNVTYGNVKFEVTYIGGGGSSTI